MSCILYVERVRLNFYGARFFEYRTEDIRATGATKSLVEATVVLPAGACRVLVATLQIVTLLRRTAVSRVAQVVADLIPAAPAVRIPRAEHSPLQREELLGLEVRRSRQLVVGGGHSSDEQRGAGNEEKSMKEHIVEDAGVSIDVKKRTASLC